MNTEGMAARVKIDLDVLNAAKKSGNLRGVQSRLGNIQGAYTEHLAKEYATSFPGVEIIQDLSHINKPGLDLVVKQGDTLKIVECKAVKDLSVSNLRNYLTIDKTTNTVTGFNVNYATQKLGDSYFTDPNINKQFILYINSPESASIASKLDLPASVPYSFKKGTTTYSGNVEIIVKAVNQ
jgi:Holliday junction resolvase-like predicted endonuclease